MFVQNASVSARQTETGLTRTNQMALGQTYILLELPVGHYELQVEAKGFQKYIQQGITLNVNETATIPVHLSVGAETQQVQVMSDAQLIQGTVTSLGKTVSEREVLDLPLNGRNFTQLGLLQPALRPLTPGLQAAGDLLRSGQAYAVNRRWSRTIFLLMEPTTSTAWMADCSQAASRCHYRVQDPDSQRQRRVRTEPRLDHQYHYPFRLQ